jgi:uncharacterized protein Usg
LPALRTRPRRREIDGPLHSVRVASPALIRPTELRYANGQFVLH